MLQAAVSNRPPFDIGPCSQCSTCSDAEDGEDRLRRDAAMLRIRQQLFTSATAPGMSALCAWTTTAHLLSDSRIKTERGTESKSTRLLRQAEYRTRKPKSPAIQRAVASSGYIWDT
jgi:hypothetical protein